MSNAALNSYDVVVILVYMLGVVALGTYFTKYVDSSEDYFLAGRMLPWWAIGMSLVSTDISSLDFVSVAGNGYKYGIVVANFDWIGCLPPLLLAAFIFVPYYWRAGIYTIPEYLGRRYNQYVRLLHAMAWGLFLVFNLAVIFWATGLMFNELIPIPDNFLGGLPREMISALGWRWANNWQIMTWILIIGVGTAIYTISGGLSAVVMTDAVQMVIMFLGGGAVIFAGFWELGGIHGMVDNIHALGPEYANHFKLLLPADSNTPYPWTGIIFGLAFVMAPGYWLGNQVIVQRTLGARSEWDAKAGVLWCGGLHALIPLLITLPGLIGLALYHGQITNPDKIYPFLLRKLLPPGMMGLVFAAFLAAMMSTVSAVLNSAATIWTKDVWQLYVVKNASDRHYLILGWVLTLTFVILGMSLAPLVESFQTIYQAVQNFFTFVQGPSLAILLLGMLWKRATPWGGFAGLLGGLGISTTLFFLHRFYHIFSLDDPFLFVNWWTLTGALVITVVVSLLTEPKPPEELVGLVYDLTVESEPAQEAIKKRVGS
jgi:solute:Na+ symporter, SSS family